MRGKILNTAILTHLLVAVPPAVVLGVMVSRINDSALRYEAQQLHLSTANRMREALEDLVEDAVAQLGHAERVLAIDALPFADRKDMLRALVASRTIPHLIVFGPNGAFDSVISIDGAQVRREAVPADALTRARERGFGLSAPREDGTLVVVVPWHKQERLLGYLGTTLDPVSLQDVADALASDYLGPRGVVSVIDARGRGLMSAGPQGEGEGLAGTAFDGLTLSGSGEGLGGLAAGISKQFIDRFGDARLAAVVSDPNLGWIVGTSRPVEVALASLKKVRQRVILMSIAAALAAGLVGLLLARRITSPIHALIAAVRRAARANFAPERQVQAKGELGQLAHAFNAAVSELARHRAELQQTTQLRLRLSRLISGAAVHDALAATSEAQGDEEAATVTVLYADVVLPSDGSIDTEHLVTVLGEFFGAANDTMRRHKGAVDRFSGDAVIGIFTGPAPAAALAAAKDLVADAAEVSARWLQHLGGPIAASVAITTGQATLQRAPDSGELSVRGDLVERAAQGQAQAEAGQVLLDPQSAQGASVQGSDGPWTVA